LKNASLSFRTLWPIPPITCAIALKRICVTVFSLFIIAAPLSTANAATTFSVTTDRTAVSMGEQIVIQATIVSDHDLKDLPTPQIPPSEAYTVLRTSGPQQSQSTQIQIVNGKMTQSKEVSYIFGFNLTPKKEGTFTFPALTLSLQNETLTSQSFQISVGSQPVETKDLTVSVIVGKRRLYVGEQTPLTIQINVKMNAQCDISNQAIMELITAVEKTFGKNFAVSRLFTNQLAQGQKQIGGELYKVVEIRFSLIPLSAGTLTLPSVPFQYDAIRQVQRRGGDPFFDDFFGGGIFGQSVERVSKSTASNSVTIEAVALPSPPADFRCRGQRFQPSRRRFSP
jgi:hypothetical protein